MQTLKGGLLSLYRFLRGFTQHLAQSLSWPSQEFVLPKAKNSELGAGFTIIEVMMFLTISLIIFAGAVLTFEGQKGKTDFNQGVRDLASKLQADIDQVGTGVFPGSDSYTCVGYPTNPRPVLTKILNGQGSSGTNNGCIFLGRAFRVAPGNNQLFTYIVLGNQYVGDNQTVSSLSDALPTPRYGTNSALIDQYNMPWGTVSSSKISYGSSTSDSYLVGFYNSLSGNYTSAYSGGQSIEALGYIFTDASPTNSEITLCVEGTDTSGCANPPTIDSWDICLDSSANNNKALLSLASTPAGVTTNIDFNSSSCS